MLEEELRLLKEFRDEKDELISDLYEIRPVIEKGKFEDYDALIEAFNSCENMSFELSTWHIKTRPVLMEKRQWIQQYLDDKCRMHSTMKVLKHEIRSLRHKILTRMNGDDKNQLIEKDTK